MRRWLLLTATLCACLPCATLLAQAPGGSRTPQAAPAPTTRPAATQPASASAPAPRPEPKPVPRSEQTVKFQFAGIPYADAVRWFAQNAGKPILGDVAISGELTFFDNTPYSYTDAFDTLNLLLAMKGFWLIETDRYFRVIPVSQVPNETKILPGLAEMEKVRPGEVVTVVILLQHVDSDTASKAVVRMVSTWGSISPLSKGKGIVITDSVKNIRRIQEFLQMYDAKSTADTVIESCALKRANSRLVVDIVGKLFAGVQRRSYERNSETGRFELVRQDSSDDTVSATADERTNSVILMGRSDRVAMAKEMVNKLDAGGGEESGDIRIFVLKNAKADELAKVLLQAIDTSSRSSSYSSSSSYESYRYRPSSDTSSSGTPVRIVPDPATNRLIVSAPADKMAAIEKLILQLDTASTAAGAATIVRLKSSDAQQLAEVVTSVLTTRGSYGRAAAGVQVAADTRTNSLILNGAAGEVQTAVKLIEDLDSQSATETREVRVIQLKAGNAGQIASSLMAMFASEVRGSYGERTSRSTIRVEADAASNTLMISAPSAQWPKVQKLLEQLTAAAEAKPVAVTRRYVLKDAKAEDVGRILREINGESAGRSYGDYSGYSSRYGRSSQSAAAVPVTVAVDRNSNTLIVSATEKDHASIAEMIKALDVPPAAQGDPVRIVTLESADAARLAQTLQAMLPPTPYGQKPEISIQADPATNTLLIRAPESQRKRLEEMIASLDKQTKANASETRTFRLKFAKASDIADVLRQMLADEGGSSRGLYGSSRYSSYSSSYSSPSGSLRVVALQDGNAIVVQGSPAKLAQAEKLIAAFDTPEAARDLAIVRIPLTKARAETLVETIRNMLPPARQGHEQEVYIEAEKATNSILLRAPEAQRTTLQTIITQLDNDSADLTREVRIIPVAHASAAALAIMFERLYSQGQASSSSYGSPYGYGSRRSRSSGGADESVIITAAPGDKALVVEAPKTKIESIAQLIASLDVENAPGNVEVRTYQISNSKVADLAESLRRLFAERAGQPGAGRSSAAQGRIEPRFEADAATNQLMVAATSGQFEEIEKVIQKLQAATVLAIQTKAFALKHARAEDLAAVLETMLAEAGGPSRRSYEGYSPYSRRSSSDASAVRVAAVPAANTIVVQGPPEKIALAEKLIAGFDTPDAAGQATVRLVPLANADAASLAALLTKMLPPPAQGKPQQVFIQADVLTNTVLLRAPEAERKMIEDLIAKLDKDAPAQVREMRIVPVKFVSASALAEKLIQLFPSSSSSGSSSGSGYDSGYGSYSRYGRTRTVTPGGDDVKRVVITAAPGDKSLIIDAPKAKIDEIVATVAKLDTEDAPSRRQVRVYQLSGSKAGEVASSLARIFAQPQQRGQGGPGGQGAAPAAPEPRFEADAASNQLMAAATAEQFVEIEKVIAQVQKATVLASQTRCFPLKNALATDLAEMLQTMLGDSSSSTADVPWWARRSSGSSAGPAVRVAAMPSANMLVVQAPPEKMLLAEQLIAQFDTDKADRQIVIEIVRLENAQAPSLADAVNAALAARRPSASRYQSGSSSGSSAAKEPAVGVTAEVNSNSILVRGPAGEVKSVVEMIKRLDQQGTSSQVQVRIFKLENSSAVDIAKSVGQLFVDMTRQRASRGVFGERAVEPPPFSVAADERTNSLVVSTTPINFQIVQEILVQLDKAGTPREVGYFYLDRADPFEVAAKLEAMYADRRGAAKPVIEADDFGRLVSVVAKEADLKAIEEVIAKLDKSTSADMQPIVRVVPVSRIPASRMAELLQKMYGQMGSADIVVTDKLPVRDANSLDANSVRIFPAPPTDLDMIYTRIEMPAATTPSAPSTGSWQAAPTTQTAPTTQATTQPAQAGENRAKISIAVDRSSNSLIVLAPRQDIESIQSLIDQLSASAADVDMELRVIRVEHASPAAVADTLEALFNPRSRGSAQSQIMQAISGRSSQGGRPGRGGQEPPPEPAAPVAQSSVTVVADMRTRSIVVRAKPSDFDMILPLVKELDRVSTVTSEVRIFTLKNTDAAEVATNLTELFMPKRQNPQSPFSPFSRSRSGSSSSSRQQTEMFLELLQMTGEGGEVGATKVDSSSLVSISANKSTNSVIVSAPTDAMKLIQKVIEEVDKSTSFSRAVRMYSLKYAEVAPTVQALREIFAGSVGSRRGSTAGRPGPSGIAGGASSSGTSGMSEPIIVTGNEAGRLILVSAPDEKHELVAKVIKDLDDAQATGEITVKVYRLENADAATLSSALVGAMQSGGAAGVSGGRGRGGPSAAGAASGQLRISADPSTNSLVVRASKEDHARITQLLAELDTAQTERYPVRTIALKHADAESVSRTLGGLFGGGAAAGGTTVRTSAGRPRTGPSAAAGAKGSVVIEPDATSRMILVRADDDTFAKIQEVVAKLDVDSTEKYPVQTIALNNANAADIAAVLNAVFGGSGAGAAGSAARRTTGARTSGGPAAGSSGGGVVTIEANAGSRMLLVRADQDTFEKIRELAAKLDTAATGSSARTLLTLKHAKAEMVAASLSQAFSASAQQRGGLSRMNPEDVVNIVPEPGTNSIIVTANTPNLERVKALLTQLDVESAGMRTELLLLKYAKAADLAPVLAQSASAGGQPAGRGRGAPPSASAATGQGVTISADNGSNALVITGPTGQIDKIIQMAMQLDRASETSSTTVRVIQLKNGSAPAVAAMIRDMYAQEQKAAQALRQQIAPLAVTADDRANALVVSTNAEMHEKVAKWISEIEAMKPSRGTMRLIQLKNVDPAEVERAIQQLYNTPGTRGPTGVQAPAGRPGATKVPAGAGTGAVSTGGRVETSVLTQQRSILINASDEDFEAIQALAKALDEAAAATRQSVQVFVLKNANNTRVAAALTSMYRPSAGRVGAAPRPEDQVTVTALAMTNAVVVSAAKERMAEVAHLIEQLDKKEVAPQLEFRIYTLENEMPTKIMPALQQLLAQIKKLQPDEAIDVQADERTRSIIVTAKGTVFEQIEKLIKTLDKPPANSAADVMVIPLKRADATRLAEVLMEMIRPSAQNQVTPEARSLQDQIRLLRLRGGADKLLPDLDLSKPIKITADPAATGQQGSNSLVVVSTSDNLKALAAIVETLDAVPLAEAAKVRLLHLDNADAATVAKILVDVFTQGQKLAGAPKSSVAGRAVPESVSGKALVNPLNVSPDSRTNTLVLSGLEESLALAEIIVKQLDVKTTVDMHDVRLLTLKNADSLSLAPTLQKMLDARVQRAAALGQLDSERLRMLVAADTRSNSLIVAGSIEGFALVKSLTEQLDAAGPALGGEIQIMPLKHANAGTLSVSLVNLFNARYEAARTPDVARQKPVIIPDLRINALLVSAGADDSKVLAGLVGKLDVEITDPAVVLEVLPLTHNDAGAIGPTIQQLFQARLTSMTPPGATPAPQDRVDVAADALANALIVSASRENLAMIRELLKKVDVEPPVESGVLKMYPLVHADAQKVATMLEGLVKQGLYKPGASFAAQTNAAVAAREKVAISVDARTNLLIISASKENLALLDQIIRSIDGDQVVSATEFRVFRLASATATVIAPTLQQLFTQRVSRETAKDPMTVIADARSNSLIVGASPADMKLAEKLIAQLDSPQGAGATMVAFPLKKADATQVANTLKALLAGQAGTGAAAAGAANISVDERTNTILVSAGAADLQRVRDLIEQLDREQLTNVTEIRVFPLQHADATELSQILTNLLTNKPLSPVALSPNRQTLLQFISKTEDGKELIATALQEGVLITPDRRSNAVVVAAPVKNMPLLESLVRSLDSISPRMAEIRVFTLVNADAQRMADVLSQLFRLQGAQQAVKAVSYTLVTTQPASPVVENGPTATVGNSEQDALSVTVDLRTNSLLIGGTKRYVELASKVIQDLDSSPAQERLTKVYRLRNAQAKAIQTAMQTFLDQEKQRLTSTLGANGMGAAQRLLEREVAVVAEETSNVLLLSASPRYFNTIEALIKELDQPPPQVLIQVMLAEMTLDETTELGMDWNVTTKWNKGRDSIGAGTQIALAAQGDGFNLSVAAGDLSFFLRALQSQGRLEVLSRPQILASDNQLAIIKVGQKVPFITNSQITSLGATINTIQYQDVGIILTVTPRINPDGFVKLDVKPEISSIASSSVTISETTKAIVINQRQAQTTVSVQDGHTIIIGGLITTKDDHREDRVPWLGDWPLIGALFRGTTKVKERSELLIILTPHVLRTIPDADKIADEQIDRVNSVRKLNREEVEDYLKKHLDDLLAQKALKDKLNSQSPTTQPAALPTLRLLTVPVGPLPAPTSGDSIPLPAMPPPHRPDEPAGVSDASWQRAQEQFLAAIAADRMRPESTR